jgi:hypothetical protein
MSFINEQEINNKKFIGKEIKSEQNSIMENDFTEISEEIAK